MDSNSSSVKLEAEKGRLADPAVSLDVVKTRDTIAVLKIELGRLKTALQRLRTRHAEVARQEDYDLWVPTATMAAI